MRLVIDLQGAQGGSHARGIGRYSRELAVAMARAPRGHDVIVALSGSMIETAESLAELFRPVLPRDNIRIWHAPPETLPLQETPKRAFAEALRAQFLASLQPDLVHICSLFEGLDDDIITVQPAGYERLPVVATIYDLIPYLRHRDYFGAAGQWGQAAQWYYRCMHEMGMCEGLLAISESSRDEAIRHLQFSPDRVFNIQAGISADFRPAGLSAEQRTSLLLRYGIRRSFILFLGGGDKRKNEAGLIAAYAQLPTGLRARHQLVIVGKTDPEAIRRQAMQLQIASDDLVLVPFVPEADLNGLYSTCDLFVFPSLHEGFGLPVAEAMACGAPAIASNTTSLPEVIGREDATFDPTDPASIASCMRRVLENPSFGSEISAHGKLQAARFTWQASAERAWDGLEHIHSRTERVGRTRPGRAPQQRPSLAFVSPMPPQASGIADYSRDLLPSLARHYDITIVCEDEIGDIRLLAAFPRLDPDSFMSRAGDFDRVLYQIGNSRFHRYQLEDLLPNCPGMVVLHDAFLSNVLDWLAEDRGRPDDFRAELWRSHGYDALRYDAKHGRDATLARFPCCLPVLQASVGVIQHSRHGVDVLRKHFGEAETGDIAIVPLSRANRPLPGQAAARALLNLAEDEFVVCSFGEVSETKCPDLLAEAWRKAGLAGKLVFVGNVSARLGRLLTRAAPVIVCAGRQSREQYESWLAAADMAVQWRANSRGESSAAMADALLAGLPLVVNSHGSASELPDGVVIKLPDGADAEALAEAIVTLHGDAERRSALAGAARSFALAEFSPESAALRYRDAIEQAYGGARPALVAARLRPQTEAMRNVPDGLRMAACCIARSDGSTRPARRGKRLLIDVSELSRHDYATGIQRVVREIARRALLGSGESATCQTVRTDRGRLRATHDVALRLMGLKTIGLSELPIDAGDGDILLCIDLNGALTDAEYLELRRMRLNGLKIVLVVYDLLPMLHPELFLESSRRVVTAWYERMISIADAVACISRAVADELVAWLDEDRTRRSTPVAIGSFHLGADFPAAAEAGAEAMSAAARAALDSARSRPTIIMTGTVEPRKGHTQALAAFEALWRDDADIGLIIIGKLGWAMDEFAATARASPHMGKELHWLSECSDSEMSQLYGAGRGLLMASSHEGFGLPIIEAARAGLPILARDVPVFREVAGAHARYFRGSSPPDLAQALSDWMQAGFTPSSAGLNPLSWDESFRQLHDIIFCPEKLPIWDPRVARHVEHAAEDDRSS